MFTDKEIYHELSQYSSHNPEDYAKHGIFATETEDCCPLFQETGLKIDYRLGIPCIEKQRFGRTQQHNSKVSKFRERIKIIRPYIPQIELPEDEDLFRDALFAEHEGSEQIFEEYPIDPADEWILNNAPSY